MKKYLIVGFLLAVAIIIPVAIKAQTTNLSEADCFNSTNGGDGCFQFDKYGACENTTSKKGCEVSIGCADSSACKVLSDSEQKNLCGTNRNVDPWEECDDNDKTNGDGCSADCQVERGWKCALDEGSDLSFCAKAVGVTNLGRQCTLFQNLPAGERCMLGNADVWATSSCVAGRGKKEYICQSGVMSECPSGNICLGGKCQPEYLMGLNLFANFDPRLKTIIFVPGGGEQSPNQIRELSRQLGSKFNIAYFPYDRSKATMISAMGLNNLVRNLLNKYSGYANPNKEFKIVAHSMGHLVARLAILMANGFSPAGSSPVPDPTLVTAYARSEFYSVAGVIGGSHYSYFWNVPDWPSRYGELNPTGSFQTWLFNETNAQKFKSAVKGYHSFDADEDSHLIDLANCSGLTCRPSLFQTVRGGLQKWWENYNRGISSDHVRFRAIDDNLDSSNHPGFTPAETNAMRQGLDVGWGTADQNYCQNNLVSYTFSGSGSSIKTRNVGHSALLFHPQVIAKIGEISAPTTPTIAITSPVPNNTQPLTGSFPLIATFSAPAGSSVKEARLYVDNNLDWTWKSSGVISCPDLFALSASAQASRPRECLLPANSQLKRMLPTWDFSSTVSHKIKFEVTDQVGRKTSAERQFTVAPPPPDTTPPTVEITAPLNGLFSPSLQTVVVEAKAFDQSGISSVRFDLCVYDEKGSCTYPNVGWVCTPLPSAPNSYVYCTARILRSLLFPTSLPGPGIKSVLTFIAYDRANSPNRGATGRYYYIE